VPKPLLTLNQVVKTFREGQQEVEVLRGVSLEVAAGELVVLEGPSGSGKTTLLSIMGCILGATSGQIWIDGEAMSGEQPRRMQLMRQSRIGFVFQDYNLFPALTALENVEYALGIRRQGGRSPRPEARRVLEAVGLGDRLNFLPRDLSGGQKQRVAIARALAGSPPILLADEPTANLDRAAGAQVLDLFRGIARAGSRALVVVTHDHTVRGIADRVLAIRDGRLAA
jgi:putative ABC transport system ATP-binding protein